MNLSVENWDRTRFRQVYGVRGKFQALMIMSINQTIIFQIMGEKLISLKKGIMR